MCIRDSLGTQAQAPDLANMDFVLKSVPDGPVAKVNGANIDASEFTSFYRAELGIVAARTGNKSIAPRVRLETGLYCLRLLVEREILLQEAKRRNIALSEDEVQLAWAKEVERAARQLPRKDGGAPPSEAEVLETAGVSREAALAEVRKDLLIAKVREALIEERGIEVSDADVEAFYEKNKDALQQPERCHLKRISIHFPQGDPADQPDARADARARIEKALQRIRAGESFEAVAKSVSEGPARDNGGDLGMIPVTSLPPVYADALADLKPGELSGIIEGATGFHIVQLVEYAAGEQASLEETAPRIREMLRARKAALAVGDFTRPIYADKDAVQIFLELERTLSTHPDREELLPLLSAPSDEAARGS